MLDITGQKVANRVIIWVFILTGLYFTSIRSYLLFHSLAELFSIMVACGIFMVAWNSREWMDNDYLLFIGIAYLFIAFLDLLHTLAYKGMGVFPGRSADLPTQLWIISRYTESISFLIAPLFIRKKIKANQVLITYLTITVLLLLSIFYWKIFPACFVEGAGLTGFKKISEYIISLIFLSAVFILYKIREHFDPVVFRLLFASFIITIFTELAFTFYISVYGLSNLIGHFFKLISFYLIYKAIIQTGLKKPHDLLFRNLKKSEDRLKKSLIDAESAKDKIDTIIKSLADGLIVTDNNHKIIMMNNVAEDILDTKFVDIKNRQINDVIKEEELCYCIKETIAEKRFGCEIDFEEQTSDSKYARYIRARTSVILGKENEKRGAVTILRDVSQEKEINQMKTEFLSIATHEIC